MDMGVIVVDEYFLMYCFRLGFSGILLSESQGSFSLGLAFICSVNPCPLSGRLRANLRAFLWLKCSFHCWGSRRGSKSSRSDDGVPWEREGECDPGRCCGDNKPTLCFMKISGAPVMSPPSPPLPVRTEIKK